MTARFGLTEKEKILQLARAPDDHGQEEQHPTTTTTNANNVSSLLLKRGPAYLKALAPRHKPLIPFKTKPKIKRASRQKVLDKLVGEHIALQYKGNIKNLNESEAVLKKAIDTAIAHELHLHDTSASDVTYLNIASRTNACDWKPEQKMAEEAYAQMLKKEEEEGRHQRKKHKKNHIAVESLPKDALVEVDLPWGRSVKDKESMDDDDQNQEKIARRQILSLLEKSPRFTDELSPEERVVVLDKCTRKIVEYHNQHHPSAASISIQPSSVFTLLSRYIDYMVKQRRRV